MSIFSWLEENISNPVQDFFGDVGEGIGDFVGNITGANQAEAATEAAQIQANAAQQAAALQAQSTEQQIAAQQAAAAQQRQDLQPFTQFGAGFISPAQQAVTQSQNLFGPNAGADVMSSPFFTALLNQANTNILQNQAVRGRLGTGETPQFLQDAALRTGFDVLNQERNAALANVGMLQSLVGMGQSAAAGQGAAGIQTAGNIANTMQNSILNQNELNTSGAAAQAAGTIGAANASAAGTGNILSIGSMLLPGPKVGTGV